MHEDTVMNVLEVSPAKDRPVRSDKAADKGPSRSDLRRRAIVEAATAVFLENGFAGTTLDKIIERSGGSRRTLYEHFGSKEGLFTAVLCRCCERILDSVDEAAFYSQTPRDALLFIGDAFLRAICDPVNLAIHRAVLSEVTRFPELGDDFYRNGPGKGHVRLADYLRQKTAEGLLNARDPELCSEQFLGMVKADIHMRALFYPDFVLSDEDIKCRVEAAVTTILTVMTP
ncbi:TetR/AcrR family transcriptional regulator [Govanella unica]|uniref:TetR/AcrR family transcriptional regulator n=1 Tax=Govanella unica TaxID=2975056 RepID=A0A9X3Z845_9PROT|nr:TetR/AcrR family transcriptional regulator [Govania unica]MDA5194761.1 TetR/AcrR family transcriptional regulator [Govania unica]